MYVEDGRLALIPAQVLVETPGLADPAPIAQTFFIEQAVSSHFRLDAIITVVDAKHIIEHLDEKKPEGVENEAMYVPPLCSIAICLTF